MAKGISPMISAVIAIMIVIVVGMIVSQWITGLSSSESEKIQSRTENKLACQFAGLYISNVTLNCTLGTCAGDDGFVENVTVKIVNSGQRELSFNKFYVVNTSGGTFEFEMPVTTLSAGATQIINSTSDFDCNGMNRTIDVIRVSSMNCTGTAYDSFPGADVTYEDCG